VYDIIYYRDRNGREPVKEYIDTLATKTDKDSRIKLGKIRDYIKILETVGESAGKPYIDHIEGDILELRPLRDRILFAGWNDDKGYILLHQFMKSTRKTPRREIDTAKRRLADILYRLAGEENNDETHDME
jgi:phage-related protein